MTVEDTPAGGPADPERADEADAEPAGSWWRAAVVGAGVLGMVGVVTVGAVGHSPDARDRGDGKATASASASASVSAPAAPGTPSPVAPSPVMSTPSPSPTATAAPTPVPARTRSAQDALKDAMRPLVKSTGAHFSVAVTEVGGAGGGVATYDSGDDRTYDTASIVKVDILASLLLQAQHAGRGLTENQRDLATKMIEQSDNDAALALWEEIGSGPGLAAANKKLGLAHTTPGSGELWGLTQTTAGDQVTLLRKVFTADGSPLTSTSRTYMTKLMGDVTAGQRWGVSAADSDDHDYALKNGWLPRSTTGLWDINSIGEVEYGGRTLLIAVLSSDHTYEQSGISVVERVAEAAAKAVAPRPSKTSAPSEGK